MKNHIAKTNFRSRVLKYYDTHQRILPWRESRNPYHIWVSEIMLQQTRVETVIPYYHRFVETLPTIESLANASDEVIYKLWEGLGYYSRVRNLRKAAKQVLELFDGVIPSDRKELETLSGIGPYTSGAISSIAFGKKNAAVDGNVLRIFARLYEITTTIKDLNVKKDIKAKVEHLLPNNRIGDFNQGLMEIGATICLPNGVPKCESCPLKEMCISYKKGTQNNIPIRNKKKPNPIHKKTVVLLKVNNRYAIEQRPDTGLLRSMYQFPLFDGHLTVEELRSKLNMIDSINSITKSKHKFSHLTWDMVAYKVTLKNQLENYLFVSKEELENFYSIPSAFKTYKEYINAK